MKIRNGFVSNSSSSSFIVQISSGEDSLSDLKDSELKMIANTESLELLENYGFQKTHDRSPLSWKMWTKDKGDKNKDYMAYNVTCNEQDVLAFLMKNNIPFKASCHYDHYYVIMEKDSDLYFYAYNFGNEIDTYGIKENSSTWEMINRTPKVERRSIKLFLRDNQ